MMGKRSGQECLFGYQVCLDRRVPDHHPLRRIKPPGDFSFGREAVADSRYGTVENFRECGRRGIKAHLAATNHGFKRARGRGLGRQQIQDLLIAACQNIRILAARVRPGRKPRPTRPPQALMSRLSAHFETHYSPPRPSRADSISLGRF